MHYDIIGDIHGHLRPLEQLLLNLGYVPTNGTWSHPERKALFLGDYIDRGPEQLGVLELVRRMVDAGSAGAIQGNHEANACAYALRGPDGEFLRPHTAKNRHQHQAFLDAVGEGSKLHDEWIEWFLTLPLWQDLGSLRIVHACWHPDQIELLQDHVAPGNRYDRSRLPDYFTRGNPLCDAVEIILKGPEVPLPPGVVFHDKDGHERRNTRIRWWLDDAVSYRDAALVDDNTAQLLPDTPLPATTLPRRDDVPVFFGHYWMSGLPSLVSPRSACLDFSIAKDGRLAAYSFDGETELDPLKLRWVEHQPEAEPEFG